VLRALEKYKNEVVPALMKQFAYKNCMQVPKLEKITINVCTSEAITNNKVLATIANDIAKISNQKPVLTKARKSISNFKLRKGMPIGCMVTLRRKNMYAFIDKLVALSIPGIRDFKGVSPKGFDKRGNYSLGVKEQTIFPELEYDKVDKVRGLSIVFTTSAKNDLEAKALLEGLGLKFRQ
jgi:large subunit ribosomal protein L5